MNKTRFSRLLLAGKAATLPMMLGQAKAAGVTPTYSDMISSDLRVIQIPSGSGIVLSSIAADSNTSSTSYAAQFCTNNTLPSSMTLVVTGVQLGETVYIAAASNKNDPSYTAVDPRLTVGSTNFKLFGMGSTQQTVNTIGGTSITGTLVMKLDTATLLSLASNGKFYIQAMTLSSAGTLRFSELDEITVGTCQTSSYGYGATGY